MGGVIDAPLYGSVLRILEWTIAGQDRLGITRQREGNRLATSAPLDNYPTIDGAIVCVVAGSDANFGRLCAAMDRDDLRDDPRYATLAMRAERADELNDLVAAWTSSHTAAEVEAACLAHEVPVGTAYSAADILADPHMAARGDLVTVDDPVAGPHRQQASYPRLDGHRPEPPRPAPRLGEHNDEVWGGPARTVGGRAGAAPPRRRALTVRSEAVGQQGRKVRGHNDGDAPGQAQQVGVASHEYGPGGLGEGDEIVTVGVGRQHRRGMLGVEDELGPPVQYPDELETVVPIQPIGHRKAGEHVLELAQQKRGDHQFVGTLYPTPEKLRGAALSGECRRCDDIRVEDRSHAARAAQRPPARRRVLRLDGQ